MYLLQFLAFYVSAYLKRPVTASSPAIAANGNGKQSGTQPEGGWGGWLVSGEKGSGDGKLMAANGNGNGNGNGAPKNGNGKKHD